MSKPQCACSQFYVKRRSGRACITRRLLAVREFNYEELALRTSKRQSACTSNNFTFARPFNGNHFLVGEREKRVRHPLLLPIEKMFGRKYVKTTMRMLTILREAEEWTRVHLREDCLLFASSITRRARFTYVKTTKRVHIK